MVIRVPPRYSDFYPRPPRGGRRKPRRTSNPEKRFLSTPSARRATSRKPGLGDKWFISIHALREEGDRLRRLGLPEDRNFYPRPPRGGRP